MKTILMLFVVVYAVCVSAHSWVTVPTPRSTNNNAAITADSGAPCGTGVNDSPLLTGVELVPGQSVDIMWADNGHRADTNPINIYYGLTTYNTLTAWDGALKIATGAYNPLVISATIPANATVGNATLLWKWSGYYCCVDVTINPPPVCDAECATCFGTSAMECITCYDDKTLVGSRCVAMDPIVQGAQVTKDIRPGQTDYYYVNATSAGTSTGKSAYFSVLTLTGPGITLTSRRGAIPENGTYDVMLDTTQGDVNTVLCTTSASSSAITYLGISMDPAVTGQYSFSLQLYDGFMNYPTTNTQDTLMGNKLYAIDAFDTATTPKRLVVEVPCGVDGEIGVSTAQTQCGIISTSAVATATTGACVPLTTRNARKYFSLSTNTTTPVPYFVQVEEGSCASYHATAYTCRECPTCNSATTSTISAVVLLIALCFVALF